jgi:hypothetical protein
MDDSYVEQPRPIPQLPYQNSMGNYAGSFLLITNPDSELAKMEMSLRGYRVDSNGDVKQAGTALMNEEGITSVISEVQSLTSQNTVMSHIDEKEIPSMMDFVADTLARDLMMNRIRYGISDPTARDKIFFMSLNYCWVTMKRAQGGGERSFWKGSTQEITMRNEGQQQGQGIISKLLGWGKK